MFKLLSVLGHLKKVVPVAKAVGESAGDLAELWADAKQKIDTDGDGRPDLKPDEAVDLLGKGLIIVARRL